MVQLEGASRDLAAFADRTPSAGIFTRLGLLAIAREQPDQALYYYYRGLMIDPNFLANYDSLGHAGWVLNQDSRVGLRYAQAGAALVERLRPLPAQEVEETAASLGPSEASTLRADWRAFEPIWISYLDGYRDRLELQEVYFSALELENEDSARASAERLLRSNSDDAEYQDAMGFVLLRFARNVDELERAANLFRQAATNTDAEHATERTADKHLNLAEELMRQIRSGNAARELRTCA